MNWLRDWFDFTPGFKVAMVLLLVGTIVIWWVLA